MAGLVAFTVIVGTRAIPWVLDRIADTALARALHAHGPRLALGIAVGSAKVFGVSMALGAFLAGLVVGRSDYSLRAASDALPMRDAFAVLFFVSVGMLLDPSDPAAGAGHLFARAGGGPGRQAARRARSIVRLLGYPFGVGARRLGRARADR